MILPTRLDYGKIPRILAGTWPKALPPSLVVPTPESIERAYFWLEGAAHTPYIALDTEFTRDGRALELIGLGYPGMAEALQIRWPMLAAPEKATVADALRALVGRVPVVYQNAVADIPVLEGNCGIRYADHKSVQDTMQAHAVLWSDWPHELAFLESLYSPCNKAKHLAATEPLKYNLGDIVSTIASWEALLRELAAAPRQRSVYETQNMPLVPLVIEAQGRGLRVNGPRVAVADADYRARKAWAGALARAYTGIPTYNIGSAKQVAESLYGPEGMPVQQKKGKGPVTVDEDAIAVLRGMQEPVPDLDQERQQGVSPTYLEERLELGAHPLLEARLLYMAAQQAHSHYILPCGVVAGKSTKRTILGAKERIYPRFLIHAQATGRWSTVEPPLAQFPADLEDLVLPDEGWVWLSWDWKNIERRMLQAETQSKKLAEIFANDFDMHTLTMCDVFGLPYPPNKKKATAPGNEEWLKAIKWAGTATQDDPRRTFGKRFSFRLDYGGAPRHADDIPGAKVLGLDGPSLVAAAERYFEADVDYKRWRRIWVGECLRKGEVESFGGRRRKLFESPEKNARIAMNTPMQAGVVDVFNKVAVDIYRNVPEALWVYGMHDRQIWAVREEHAERIRPRLQEIAEQPFSVRGRETVFPVDWKETRHG